MKYKVIIKNKTDKDQIIEDLGIVISKNTETDLTNKNNESDERYCSVKVK